MIRALAVVLSALVLSACGAEPAAQPELTPVPAVSSPKPEPEPKPVQLTATLTVDGDTVTVFGQTNLPVGAMLVWELAETVEAFASNPDVTLRDPDGEVPDGEATVADGGGFRFEVSGEGWAALGLCEVLPLELSVSYMPWADVAALGTIPEQPENVYALHGERGERVPGAVPPAELRTLTDGLARVVFTVSCP